MVGRECLVLLTQSSLLGPVPERPISANRGLKFCSRFCILPFCVLPGVAFCVIITVCRSRGSTVFCKLQLHVTSASLDSSPISYLFTYRHGPGIPVHTAPKSGTVPIPYYRATFEIGAALPAQLLSSTESH